MKKCQQKYNYYNLTLNFPYNNETYNFVMIKKIESSWKIGLIKYG